MPQTPLPADLVMAGGRVLTMDPSHPAASGVAVGGGHIVYVGDDAGALRLAGPATRVIDLRGRVLAPGFIDGHTHVVGLGDKMRRIPLEGVRAIPELLALVQERARLTPPGQWILGNGEFDMFHERKLAEGRLPSLRELDEAAPKHPLFLTRGDDAALVNGLALRLAGIDPTDAGTAPDAVARDAAGRPTGFVAGKEGLLLFRPVLPTFAPNDRTHIMREMAARFHAAGVTSVVDCGLADGAPGRDQAHPSPDDDRWWEYRL